MTLQDEAMDYWKICQKYRRSLTKAGKAYVVNIEIPTLQIKLDNLRIKNQLSDIMFKEGVQNHEDQSIDPCA